MDIFRAFRKKSPVLLRCTECYNELERSTREVHRLERKNAGDPVCPVKEACHICHIGFLIPVSYTGKDGKHYLFHQIKPKIKNLTPDAVMERIFENPDTEITMFFNPFDEL